MPYPSYGQTDDFSIIFAVFIGVIVIMIGKSIMDWSKNQASPVQNQSVSVVSKRDHISGGGGEHHHTTTTYYVTFQFQDGSRIELRLPASVFGLIAEGDLGMLNYQGTQFNSFNRVLPKVEQEA